MVRRFVPRDVEGVETHIKKVLDEASIVKNGENKKLRLSAYASDYGQCMRKVWFQFFPELFDVEMIDARTARIFANGNAVHERLGMYLKMDPSIHFVDEVNVPRDELDVHGRCDGLVTVNDQEIVLEFKSINKESLTEAKEEHVGQVSWYMYQFTKLRAALREEFGLVGPMTEDEMVLLESAFGRRFADLNDVEKRLVLSQGDILGEVIYELKGTQKTIHFPVLYDEGCIERIKLWYVQLNEYVRTKVRPEVKYASSRFPCSWRTGRCQYFKYCYGGEQQKVEEKGVKGGDKLSGQV